MKDRDDVVEAVRKLREKRPHLYFDDVVAILEPKMNGVTARDFISGVREALKRTDTEAFIGQARDLLIQCLGVDEFPPVAKRGSGAEAHYEVTFRDVAIDLGTAAEMLVPAKVEAAFLAAVDWTPNLPPRARWRACASALAQAAVQIPTGTEAEETAEWVSLFIAGKTSAGLVTKSAQWVHLDQFGAVVIEGVLYVNSTRMAKDLLMIHAIKVTANDLARRLSRLGFKPDQLAFRLEEGVRTRRTWRAPDGFDPDSVGDLPEILVEVATQDLTTPN